MQVRLQSQMYTEAHLIYNYDNNLSAIPTVESDLETTCSKRPTALIKRPPSMATMHFHSNSLVLREHLSKDTTSLSDQRQSLKTSFTVLVASQIHLNSLCLQISNLQIITSATVPNCILLFVAAF